MKTLFRTTAALAVLVGGGLGLLVLTMAGRADEAVAVRAIEKYLQTLVLDGWLEA